MLTHLYKQDPWFINAIYLLISSFQNPKRSNAGGGRVDLHCPESSRAATLAPGARPLPADPDPASVF